MAKVPAQAALATVGIDLGDKKSFVCVLDEAGHVIEEATLPTTKTAFAGRFKGVPRMRIAIETGTHSSWVSRLLTECDHEVIVANARKLRLIYENDNKSDRVDAENLARLARVDPKLLSPITHRSAQMQSDMALLLSRDALVRARTALVNQVRGLVKSVGGRIPSCSSEVFAKTAPAYVPKELWPAIAPVLDAIARVNAKARELEKRIEAAAKARYPATQALQQISGVGPITALAFVLTIADPRRFRNSRSVGAYLGLRPRKDESGESDPQLRITKAGNSFVRKLMVQAAHYILGPFGPDTDLRRWGLKLAERGGKNAKKRAVVAVGRKLAVLLHRLWVTGRAYVPLREAA